MEAGGRACLTVYMESGLALDLRRASPETGRHTEPPRTPLARRMLWMVTLAPRWHGVPIVPEVILKGDP